MDTITKLINGTFIPATPLALDDNRKFDEETQRGLIRYYLDSGVGGIATAVHSTQFEIRDPQYNLFAKVLEVVADEVNKYTKETIVKISGVCGKVEQAVREAETAKAFGYDAALLSPGGLRDLTEDELIERAYKVADVMPVVGFYLQEAVGGRRLSYNFWRRFCAIENVCAIKCASFNRYTTVDTMRAAATSPRADKIGMYTGNDDNIGVDLLTNYKFTVDGKIYEKRFTGGLLGHWAVWTKPSVQFYNRFRAAADAGEITPELLTLAAEITDSNAVVFDAANGYKGCIAGMHEILRRDGYMKNILCLNPDEKLSPGQTNEIERIYKMYPHLV
ncbi:MAG: dihydrodipicolinate synthase family protein [Oscillospiraceae bacterium]|nr:dihydrodipicolinate synthase family protein [Oscillospiraceae bacterium]